MLLCSNKFTSRKGSQHLMIDKIRKKSSDEWREIFMKQSVNKRRKITNNVFNLYAWLIKYSCKKSKVIEKVKVVSIAGKLFEITTVLMNLSPWQHLKLLWMHWIVCPVVINEDIPSIYRMGVHLASSIPQCWTNMPYVLIHLNVVISKCCFIS